MSYRRGYCSEDVIFFSTACMDEIVQGLHTASRAPHCGNSGEHP